MQRIANVIDVVLLLRIALQIEQLIAEAPWIEVAKTRRDFHHLRALSEIKTRVNSNVSQFTDFERAVDTGRHQGVFKQMLLIFFTRRAHIDVLTIGNIDVPAKIAKQRIVTNFLIAAHHRQ